MPTKNRGELAKRAIESVLAQDYTNWELLVVDDGSEDGSYEMLQLLAESDKRIHLYRHSHSKGACAARNYAIDRANGPFITGLDDDDEFTPDRLSVFLSKWQDEVGFLCSPVTVVRGVKHRNDTSFIGEITPKNMLVVNRVGNQVFCKTEDLKAIKGFDESLKAWQDYDAWLRLVIHCGTGWKIEEPTYLQHEIEGLPSITRSQNRLLGCEQFIKKHDNLFSYAQKAAMQCWLHIIKRRWIPITMIFKAENDILKYSVINNLYVIKNKLFRTQ